MLCATADARAAAALPRLPCAFEKLRCLELVAKALHSCVEELSTTRTPSMSDDFDDGARACGPPPPRPRVAALSNDDMLPLMCLCLIRCVDPAGVGGRIGRGGSGGGSGGGGAGSGSSTSDRGSESASRSGAGGGGGMSSLVPHWRANVVYLESCTSPSDSFMKRCGRVVAPARACGMLLRATHHSSDAQVLFCAARRGSPLPERRPHRHGGRHIPRRWRRRRGGGGIAGVGARTPPGGDSGNSRNVLVRSSRRWRCGWRGHATRGSGSAAAAG